jgi:methionyl-tRNA formyltransferase
LTKEHGLIDWNRPAPAVCNQIRAMQPWPTAYTYLHEAGHRPQRLLILRAAAREGQADKPYPPGEVLPSQDRSRLLVRAGSGGIVEILELQPAGKRRMAAVEFLRGHRLQARDRFGPEAP